MREFMPARHRSALFVLPFALAASLPVRAAERWVPIGPEGGTIRALAADPRSPATLYAGTGAGVYKTKNGGVTWAQSPTLAEGVILALAIDPRRPSTLYATTGSLWKSVDGGARWR